MNSIDLSQRSALDRYRLLIGSIVPRPIAWVTTLGESGVLNLAPFSFFNGVCASPPIVSVSIAHRVPEKDTLRNLRTSGQAVVHLVPGPLLDACHASGAEYPSDVSEAGALGLATVPSQVVRPARLASAQVAMECRLHQIISVGEPSVALCLLEVLVLHLDEGVTRPDGLVDPTKLCAVARLGGDAYLATDGWTLVERQRQRQPGGIPPKA